MRQVLIVLFVFVYTNHFPFMVEAQSNTIKIGAIYGMSGTVARYGQWAVQGARLACDQINANGGIQGRTLELVVEDNQGQPAQSVTAFQKLKNLDQVQYVLTFLSSVALAVEPLANRSQIVQMDISATTSLYSTPNDYSFRTGLTANQIAVVAATFMAKELGVRDVACLHIENDFGQGMMDVFRKSFPGKITSVQTFRSGEQDFRPQLIRIRGEKAANIWFVGHLQESGQLLREAKELGLNVRFYSDVYSIEGSDFLEAAHGAAEGLIYFGPSLDTHSSDAEVQHFTRRYKELFSEYPNYFAAQAYDGVVALFKAMEMCLEISTSCVKDSLYRVKFSGASGEISFDQNGDVQKKNIFVKTIKNGQFVDIKDLSLSSE